MGAKKFSPLEKRLCQSDDVLLSCWMYIGSLIYHFEGLDWATAQAKALTLFRKPEAVAYVQSVRQLFNSGASNSLNAHTYSGLNMGRTIQLNPYVQAENKRNKYEKNFDRLLELVPDIELHFKGESLKELDILKGESHVEGYKKISFEALKVQDESLVFTLTEFKRGSEKISEKFTLWIDFKSGRLEALKLQQDKLFFGVYSDIYKREWQKKESKIQQNNYLKDWLKKRIKQRHSIKLEDTYKLFQEIEEERREEHEQQLRQEERERIEAEQEEQRLEAERLEELRIEEQEQERKKQEYRHTIQSITKKLNWSEQEVSKHTREHLDYRENYNRASKAHEKFKLSTSFDALSTENYRILLELIPDLEERLKFRHCLGAFYTSNGNWLISWARSLGNGSPRFIMHKEPTKENSLNPPALVVFDTKRKKVGVQMAAKGFYGLQEFDDTSNEKGDAYRLEANNEFHSLLSGLAESECVFEWLTDPSIFEIQPFELGKVELLTAHEIEGINQEYIDWVNEHQTSLKIEFDAPKDKSSFSFTDIIWYQAKKLPVFLNPNGTVTLQDSETVHKKG